MKKIYILMLMICLSVFSANEIKAQCAANFSYTTAGNVATFTDMSTATVGSVVSWGWNFGDGGFSGSQNPTHTYAACGAYSVSLTIFTSAFCSNTFTDTIIVNGGITPTFTYTVDTTTGNVNFQAQPFGLNLDYVWNFGDGTFDSTFAPNHTYPAGVYPVCLTVSDNAGICTATVCDTITVNIVPPSCTTTFTFNDNGSGNVSFQVAPFSFGMTYNWDFGDGTTGTGGFSFHTFPTFGSYTVCLTAVDSATMCISNFCDTVVLTQDITNCDVTFTYADNNGQVTFTANSFSFNNSYAWDFGDLNTGTGVFTTNTYDTSGVYWVCLTTNNSFDACSATYCDSVQVVITGIEELQSHPFKLEVYPNPMNDQTTISYQLKDAADIRITVTDVIGKIISISENKNQAKGNYSFRWKPEELKAGIYLLQLKADDRVETKKLVITK
jgi:PKD repeat protein